MEFPLEFCNGSRDQQLVVRLLVDGRNSLMIRAFVSIQYQSMTDGQFAVTVPECEGKSDRQFAITVSRRACIGMLMGDKKCTILYQCTSDTDT